MEVTGNLKYVADVTQYIIDGNDGIINVDTSVNPVLIVLPNINNSGYANTNKGFIINDISNNAATNNITIVATNNSVNSTSSVVVSNDGGTAKCSVANLNEWFVIIEPQTGSTSNVIIPIIYDDLVLLIGSASVIEGQKYLLTDFQTIYEQPDYDSSGIPKPLVNVLYGSVEPLILEGISNVEISSTVQSTIFPFDKILYNWNFQFVPSSKDPAKGIIIERIDSDNNRTDYDHRAVLFKRYETSLGSGVYVVINDNGFASRDDIPTFGTNCYSNYIGNFYSPLSPYLNGFILPNNIFGNSCFNNITGNNFMNNTILDLFSNNTIENNFYQNELIGNDFSNNVIGNFFQLNKKIGSGFMSNHIGNYFQDNLIGESFGSDKSGEFGNIIGNNFQSNTIGSDGFINNSIQNNFRDNIIEGGFEANKISNNFTNNELLGGFSSNNIGNSFSFNTGIENGFSGNQIGDSFISNVNINISFQNNIIGNSFNNNSDIGSSFSNNQIGYYFANNSNIGDDFSNNVILNNFANNTSIGTFFTNNNIGNDFQGNAIGDSCNNNTINDFFDGNTIGIGFNTNNIDISFQTNVILDSFNSNKIGYNFINNTIGNNFFKNEIGVGFQSNGIADFFSNNSILADFVGNTNIGNNFNSNTTLATITLTDFSLATYVYGNYTKNILIASSGSPYLEYLDDSALPIQYVYLTPINS